MAGPWFTVQRSSTDWNDIARIDLSDGTRTAPATVRMRLILDAPGDPAALAHAHPPGSPVR